MLSAGRAVPSCTVDRRASATCIRTPVCPIVSPACSTRIVPGAGPSTSAPVRQPLTIARASTSPASASNPKAEMKDLPPLPSTANGKLISKTEVAAFIQRDDLMDQIYRWAFIEAGESGVRNFGLPMNVEPVYYEINNQPLLWGFKVGIFKEGTKLCDLGIMFDTETVSKHEWVGRGDNGFPVLEGRVDNIMGKHFEIWKLDMNPVDETLRSAIRSFCTGLVSALNRYYAFGSVFVDDAQ